MQSFLLLQNSFLGRIMHFILVGDITFVHSYLKKNEFHQVINLFIKLVFIFVENKKAMMEDLNLSSLIHARSCEKRGDIN